MYIRSINIGMPQMRERNGSDVLTGGDKQPVAGAYLGSLGFEGDGQADTVHHGGIDKAVCVYSFDHYGHWETVLKRQLSPGSFSENLTIAGIDERTVCIGDIFRGGAALLQVTQPRMPCTKLAGKHGEPQLVTWVEDTNFTGFYMRVLAEGRIAQGDTFELVQPHADGISIAAVNDIIYKRVVDRELIAKLANMPEFGASGRSIFAKRLAKLAEQQ